MPEQTIGEVVLQGSSKLIFNVSEWHGKQFAGVRKYVTTQKYKGWTKAGLSLNKKLLHELIAVLTNLEKTIPPQSEQEFKRLPKTNTEYIKIVVLPSDEGDGLPAVDVREFVDSPSYQGPTKSGVRFRWNVLPDVLACLREQAKVIGQIDKTEPSLFGTGALAAMETPPQETPQLSTTDGLVELLGEQPKQFPDDFVDGVSTGKGINLPDIPLVMEQANTGAYHLKTQDGVFCPIRNPAEGNFIIYAQMRGHKSVAVPKEMIQVFKTVKAYENYARAVQTKLVAKILKKAGQRSVAEYEARKKMGEAGLPWLASG